MVVIMLTSAWGERTDHLYDGGPLLGVQYRDGTGAQPGCVLHIPNLDGL